MNDDQKLQQSDLFKQRADKWVKVRITVEFSFDMNIRFSFFHSSATTILPLKDIKTFLILFSRLHIEAMLTIKKPEV
jgi:hypothetical protein